MVHEITKDNVEQEPYYNLVRLCWLTGYAYPNKALATFSALIDGEDVSRTQYKGRHLELTQAILKATGR